MVVTNIRCVCCYGIDGLSALLWHWPKNLVGKFFKFLGGSTTRKGGGVAAQTAGNSKKSFWLMIIPCWSDFSCNCIKRGWSRGSEEFDLRVQSGFWPRNSGQAGALCRVHCLRNPILNPYFSFFFLQFFIFYFWWIASWGEILRMENLVGVGSAQIALSQKTLLNSLPQICLILSNLLKLNTEILVSVGRV